MAIFTNDFDTSKLDEILVPREPYIYAFTTNTIPKYLKVGDTFRGVSLRLSEWKKVYGDLNKIFEDVAKVGKSTYFRDYSVHDYLMRHGKTRLKKDDLYALEKQQGLGQGSVYYSEEFFKDAAKEDVKAAIDDITAESKNTDSPYTYYDLISSSKTERKYKATQDFDPRGNQKTVIDNFKKAVAAGRKNLLMYAVMRFGKTFTALSCAKAIDAKFVVVVSAKADVADEWQKGVQSHKKIAKTEENPNGYKYLGETDLKVDYSTLNKSLDQGERVVLFVTLQTLFKKNGEIKVQHKQLFERHIDLLIIDETHFGASGNELGKPLPKGEDEAGDFADSEEAETQIKKFKTNVTLHLSGTPYKLIMGNTFEKNDVVAFVQYSDILNEKEKWEKSNGPDAKAWENPYFGFPKMIRFAFDLNESSKSKLEELRKSGISYSLNELFAPVSTEKTEDGKYYFKHEEEVLAFLRAIDGSKEDSNIFPFLNHDKIQQSCLCKHLVFVLPYRASCDAMAQLLENHSAEFINLGKDRYKVIKAVSMESKLMEAKTVRSEIKKADDAEGKTITLTVKHLLTGCTIPYWDTMLFLKDTESAQEYDQAIFRLQSAFIKETKEKRFNRGAKKKARKTGAKEVAKLDAKPQTLLIDFHPNRMFYMEENRAQVATAYEGKDDDAVKQKIKREQLFSPIFVVGAHGLQEVETNDIMRAVSQYRYDKGIREEACDIPVDLSILDDPDIAAFIKQENPIGAKGGLSVPGYESKDGKKTDAGMPDPQRDKKKPADSSKDNKEKEVDPADQIRSSYLRILLYAFLTESEVDSVKSILKSVNKGRNRVLIKNLGLTEVFLQKFYKRKQNKQATSALNRAILKAHTQASDEKFTGAEHVDTVLKKFGKLGEAAVVTPKNICADMVALIPDEAFTDAIKTSKKFLDIAGTSGEFAIALYDRMKALGIPEEKIKNAIYTIPKSSISYELTRKVYTLLDLNVENIAAHFNAQSIIKIKKKNRRGKETQELDYEQIQRCLSQKKKFCNITLEPFDKEKQGVGKVKFEAIVGNPPYQGTNHQQVYPYFYRLAICLGKYASIIFPVGWQQPKNANNLKLLNNEAIKCDRQIVRINNLQNVFPGISGAEWVNTVLWEKGFDNGLAGAQLILTNGENPQEIMLPVEETAVAKPPQILALFECVKNKGNFTSMQSTTSMSKPYGIRKDIFAHFAKYGLPPMQKNRILASDIAVYGSFGEIQYIPVTYPLPRRTNAFAKYKVFVGSAWGNMSERTGLGGAYADIIVAKPYEICTETYQESGCYDDLDSARKQAKYLMTKFARALLYVNKLSQMSTTAWGAVPVQDFSEEWWDESIEVINKKLMEKYNVPNDIRDFVEKNIQGRSEENIVNF